MFVAIANFGGENTVFSWIRSCFNTNIFRVFRLKSEALDVLINCPPLPVAKKYGIVAKTYSDLLVESLVPEVAYPLSHASNASVHGFLFQVLPERKDDDNIGILVDIEVIKTPTGYVLSEVDCCAPATVRWYFSQKHLYLLWLYGQEEKIICCDPQSLLDTAEEEFAELSEIFSLARLEGEFVDTQEVNGIEVSLLSHAISLTITPAESVSLSLWTLYRPYLDTLPFSPFYREAETLLDWGVFRGLTRNALCYP